MGARAGLSANFRTGYAAAGVAGYLRREAGTACSRAGQDSPETSTGVNKSGPAVAFAIRGPFKKLGIIL